MGLSTPPPLTVLNHATYPHRKYHSGLTEVRYAHPDGSNSEDGLTWGTAKQDVGSAYDALPSTGGTVKYAHGTGVDISDATRGLWIAGIYSANYGSLPAGWRQAKRLKLVGVGGTETSELNQALSAHLGGGSSTDRNKPALWLAGVHTTMEFENVHWQYPAICARIGVETDGLDTVTTAGVSFTDCGFTPNSAIGNGPTIELGYTFWCEFIRGSVHGMVADWPISACSIVSGTTARFTIGTHNLLVGDQVQVKNVTPAGYNGNWIVTAIAATTFDANIGTSPGAGSVFGAMRPIRSYRRSAIGMDTVDVFATGDNAGWISIRDTIFMQGGLFWHPNALIGTGSLEMRNITQEGDFVSPEPPIFYFKALGGEPNPVSATSGQITLEALTRADVSNAVPAIKVDSQHGSSAGKVVAINCDVVEGPATQIGSSSIQNFYGNRFHPIIAGDRIQGRMDAVARALGAAPVLFTNLARQDPADWTNSTRGATATISTGQKGPDGSTNAGRLTGNGFRETFAANLGLAAGDWLISGVWRRQHTGVIGYQGGILEHYNAASIVYADCSVNYQDHRINIRPDGAWDWTCVANKIASVDAGMYTRLEVGTDGGEQVDYAYPLVIHVPAASAFPDAEMYALATLLRSWPDGAAAVAGSTALPRGSALVFAPDVSLYRSAANILKTDDTFIAELAHTGDGSLADMYHSFQNSGNEWRIRLNTGTNSDFRIDDHTAGLICLRIVKATGEVQVPNGLTDGTNAYRKVNQDYIPPTYSQGGNLAVGTGPFRWYNDTGRTLTIVKVRASVGTAPTGAAILIDVNRDGTTIFSGGTDRPNIAVSTNTDTTTGMSTTTIADGSYFTVDIDQVGSTITGADLTVQIFLAG
jgi:hypothetical protein